MLLKNEIVSRKNSIVALNEITFTKVQSIELHNICFKVCSNRFTYLSGFLFEDTRNGECRPGFVRVDQWCFSFHTKPTSMLQSSDVCHQHGAHMAVLDSQEKEKALTEYIERKGLSLCNVTAFKSNI